MPNILNLTVDQLRVMSRADIRTAFVAYFQNMTKREMILWLLETDLVQDTQKDTYENGQIVRRVEYDRDIETGVKVKGKITTWSYYPGGEIDTIKIMDIDSSDLEISSLRIKHYLDGKQPTIESNNFLQNQVQLSENLEQKLESVVFQELVIETQAIVESEYNAETPIQTENCNIFDKIIAFIENLFGN